MDFNSVSAFAPVVSKTFDVVFVGRFLKENGVDVLLSSVPLVERMLGRKILVGISGDGPELGHLVHGAYRFGITDSVRFLGSLPSQDEVYRIFKASRIFVCPQAPEGAWTIATLEANAAGLPVITSDSNEIGSGREIVLDSVNGSVNGSVIASCTAELLPKEIARLLTDGNLLGKLRKSSVEHARQYDGAHVGRDTLELYTALLESNRLKRN